MTENSRNHLLVEEGISIVMILIEDDFSQYFFAASLSFGLPFEAIRAIALRYAIFMAAKLLSFQKKNDNFKWKK